MAVLLWTFAEALKVSIAVAGVVVVVVVPIQWSNSVSSGVKK